MYRTTSSTRRRYAEHMEEPSLDLKCPRVLFLPGH